MPGRWIWQRSAAKPAPASTIDIRLSKAAKDDLIEIWLSMRPDVILDARLKLNYRLFCESW